MTSLLLTWMLLSCGRLASCGQAPEPTPTPVVVPVVEPQPLALARPWAWAAVVRVDPAQAQIQEIALAAVEGAPAPVAPLDAPAGTEAVAVAAVPIDVAIVRDALAGQPVSLFRAAPGASLEIPVLEPGAAPASFTVPSPVDGAPAAEWIVVTDQGVHALTWPESQRLREIEVALSMHPWRVVVALPGPGSSLGLGQEEIVAKLAEQGVVLLLAQPDQVLAVPWSDAPLGEIDLPALIAEAGPGATVHYVVAQKGVPPMVIEAEAPVMLLKRASTYFGLELTPRRGAEAGPGIGQAGKGGKVGKTGKFGKGGKAGKAGKAGPRGGQGFSGKAGKQGKVGKSPPPTEETGEQEGGS